MVGIDGPQKITSHPIKILCFSLTPKVMACIESAGWHQTKDLFQVHTIIIRLIIWIWDRHQAVILINIFSRIQMVRPILFGKLMTMLLGQLTPGSGPKRSYLEMSASLKLANPSKFWILLVCGGLIVGLMVDPWLKGRKSYTLMGTTICFSLQANFARIRTKKAWLAAPIFGALTKKCKSHCYQLA